MKSYLSNCDKQCSYCKKKFSMFFYDTRRYVYKIKLKNKKTIYQCSYPCYKKEKERNENSRNASKRPSEESDRVF